METSVKVYLSAVDSIQESTISNYPVTGTQSVLSTPPSRVISPAVLLSLVVQKSQ